MSHIFNIVSLQKQFWVQTKLWLKIKDRFLIPNTILDFKIVEKYLFLSFEFSISFRFQIIFESVWIFFIQNILKSMKKLIKICVKSYIVNLTATPPCYQFVNNVLGHDFRKEELNKSVQRLEISRKVNSACLYTPVNIRH